MNRILLFSILLSLSAASYSQSPKVDVLFAKAKLAYSNKSYKIASQSLEGFIAGKFDTQKAEAIAMLADCYWNMRTYQNAKFCYDKLLQLGVSLNEKEQFRNAELLAMSGDYNAAQASLAKLPMYKAKMLGYEKLANYLRDSLDYSVQYLNVNTNSNKEFSPTIINNSFVWVSNVYDRRHPAKASAFDGANLFSVRKLADTSMLKKTNYTPVSFTASAPTIYTKKLALNFEGSDKYLLSKVPKIKTKGLANSSITGQPIYGANTSIYYNVSNLVYSPVLGKYFLTVNHKKKASKKDLNKNLYIAQADIIEGVLSNIEKIDLGSSSFSYMHPAIDPSGKFMVFSSNADDENNFDLFYIIRTGSGWSRPIKFPGVNTNGDEVFPSFSSTGDLYFSSNGFAGLGGLDMYKVAAPFASGTSLVAGIQFQPMHLLYPINSKNDDFGIAATQDPNNFYFSSDRLGTDDIFYVNFKEVKYTIDGKVSFNADATLLPTTTLYFKNRTEDTFLDSIVTDANSSYRVTVKPNRIYDIYMDYNGSKKLVDSINTSLIRTSTSKNVLISGQSFTQLKDSLAKLQAIFIAYLQKRAADSLLAHAAPNEFRVHYGFNKYVLDKNDIIVLDSLVQVLNNNQRLQVTIGSFTDCKGNVAYNQKLSAKRSKAAIAYLKKKVIASNRINSSNYGKAYFVLECSKTKYGKAGQIVNRRTELLLTEQKNITWEKLHQTIDPQTHKVLSSLALPMMVPKKAEKVSVNRVLVDVAKGKPVVIVKPKVDTVKVKPVVVVKPKVDTIKAKPVVVVKPKTDTVKVKPVVKASVAPVVQEEEAITKEEIIKALDSLAKLRTEQERIVNYLTKRINKKPILIYTESDSVNVEIYDSGIHDKDSVSIIYNNRIVVDRKELNVKSPIKFALKVSSNPINNQLIFVAENLGFSPPNTAVMIITDKNNKRQEIILNTDLAHNEVVHFIKIVKK